MTHILVTVRGGNIESIIADNADTRITVLDWDNPTCSTLVPHRVVPPKVLRARIADHEKEVNALIQTMEADKD
ncbi:MAG: hypothetical protein ACREHG_08170 [Candidatus Saccharimonadales bacterium]